MSYEDCLVGLWIEGQKYYMGKIKERPVSKETVILRETKKWLDEYFDGCNPSISRLKIAPEGTEFQKESGEYCVIYLMDKQQHIKLLLKQ